MAEATTEVTTSTTVTATEDGGKVDGNVWRTIITTAKLHKYIFTKKQKLLLLHEVREYGTHHAPYRKKDEAFEKVKDTLIHNMPSVTWLRYQKPQMKTVCGKFRSLVASGRKKNKRNANASGVQEVLGSTD